MRLLLFDVDGTLLLSGGAGMRCIDRVVWERFGVERGSRGVEPDGKTDPVIFREVLARLGPLVEDPERELEMMTVRYVELMGVEVAASEGARLMPGVLELLSLLHIRHDVALGLLTGNLEATARLKLERFDLNRFFPVGAFASDDERRERLVPIAVRRAERLVGCEFGLGDRVMVIGDTPRDVACAVANGVVPVGVAAWRYSVEDLKRAGATVVLPGLADAPRVIASLGL